MTRLRRSTEGFAVDRLLRTPANQHEGPRTSPHWREQTMEKRIVAVVVSVLVMIALVAIGTTAEAGSSTTYFGCLKKGSLRSVGTAPVSCGTSSTAVSWNAQGPSGPAGPTGPTGPTGPQGPSTLPATFTGVNYNPVPIADGDTLSVAHVAVPAGNYTVTADVDAHNNSSPTALVNCYLSGGSDSTASDIAPSSEESWSVTSAVTVPSAGNIDVLCEVMIAGPGLAISGDVTATAASSINLQFN